MYNLFFILLSIGGCVKSKKSDDTYVRMDEDTSDSDTSMGCLPQGEASLLLWIEVDAGNNGTVDFNITYTYDNNGNLIMVEEKNPAETAWMGSRYNQRHISRRITISGTPLLRVRAVIGSLANSNNQTNTEENGVHNNSLCISSAS